MNALHQLDIQQRRNDKAIRLAKELLEHCQQNPQANILIIQAAGTKPQPWLLAFIEKLKARFPLVSVTIKQLQKPTQIYGMKPGKDWVYEEWMNPIRFV